MKSKASIINKRPDAVGEVFSRGGPFPPLLYGLSGVMSVFNVSKPTASRYVNGLIKDSVTRNGKNLLIDTRKALECFGIECPERFIKF